MPRIRISVPNFFEIDTGGTSPPPRNPPPPPQPAPPPVPKPKFEFSPDFEPSPALFYFKTNYPPSNWFFSQEKQCKLFALNRHFQISSDNSIVMRKKNFFSTSAINYGFVTSNTVANIEPANNAVFLQNYANMNTVVNVRSILAKRPASQILSVAASDPRARLMEIVEAVQIDPILVLIFSYLNPSDLTTVYFWGFEKYLGFVDLSSVIESQKMNDFGSIEVLVIKWIIAYRDEILQILNVQSQQGVHLFPDYKELLAVFLYSVNNTSYLEPLLTKNGAKNLQNKLFYSLKVRDFVKQLFSGVRPEWPPVFCFYDDSRRFDVSRLSMTSNFSVFFDNNPILKHSPYLNEFTGSRSLIVPSKINFWAADSPEFISFNGSELKIKSDKEADPAFFFNFLPVFVKIDDSNNIYLFVDTNLTNKTINNYMMVKGKKVAFATKESFGQVEICKLGDLPVDQVDFYFAQKTTVNGSLEKTLFFSWVPSAKRETKMTRKSKETITRFSISNNSIVPNMISDQKLFYFSPWSLVYEQRQYLLDSFLFYVSANDWQRNNIYNKILQSVLVPVDFSYAFSNEHFDISYESEKKQNVRALVFPVGLMEVFRFRSDNSYTLSNKMVNNKTFYKCKAYRYVNIRQTYVNKNTNNLGITMSLNDFATTQQNFEITPISLSLNIRHFDELSLSKEFDNLIFEFKNLVNFFYGEEENRRLFLSNDQDDDQVNLAMPDDRNLSAIDNALLAMLQDYSLTESSGSLSNGYTVKYKIKDYSCFSSGGCSKFSIKNMLFVFGRSSRSINNSYDHYMPLNQWGRIQFKLELFLTSQFMEKENVSDVLMFDYLIEADMETGELVNVTNFKDNFTSPKQPYFNGEKVFIDYDRTFTRETSHNAAETGSKKEYFLCMAFFKKFPNGTNINPMNTLAQKQLFLFETKIIFEKI